ncbi:hypothetical protein SAMN05660649_01949 [Desulfotomaculum arcticum]|uniref:Uncharacterized protein n=1 Tax=Desulfotruncus arcticus DSM 17038 TaxID=1121424 RepID=A0A1I2SQ99_9FIRM|nr:hypothetical protein SAMN05660649_01949 [Desulfotomaculum arcticum] [Desulfotruncus arcticus DSM 17038]
MEHYHSVTRNQIIKDMISIQIQLEKSNHHVQQGIFVKPGPVMQEDDFLEVFFLTVVLKVRIIGSCLILDKFGFIPYVKEMDNLTQVVIWYIIINDPSGHLIFS